MKTIPESSDNILSTAQAFNTCVEHNDPEKANWGKIHRERIEKALLDVLPHGSGIDCKWKIEIDKKYITCSNSYHCMNDAGYYDGWIDFKVMIDIHHRDIWGDIDFEIKGRLSRNYGLRDYLEELFNSAFETL